MLTISMDLPRRYYSVTPILNKSYNCVFKSWDQDLRRFIATDSTNGHEVTFHFKVVDFERGAAEAEISRRLWEFAAGRGTPHVFIRYESAAVWDPCPREPPDWEPQSPRVRMVLVSKAAGLSIDDLVQQTSPVVSFSAEQLVKGYRDLIFALAALSLRLRRPDPTDEEDASPPDYRFWHGDSHSGNLVVSPTDGRFCLIDYGSSALVWAERGKLHKIDPLCSDEEVAPPEKTVQVAREVFTSFALRVRRKQPWYDLAVRFHDVRVNNPPEYSLRLEYEAQRLKVPLFD
jgi:hypothetical protein